MQQVTRQAERSREIGRRGEQTAAEYFEQCGYAVLDRNWRSSDPAQRGELDLVLRDRSVLVICEVKTRTRGPLAHPAEAVTRAKLARLRRLAVLWLREHAPGREPAGAARCPVGASAGGYAGHPSATGFGSVPSGGAGVAGAFGRLVCRCLAALGLGGLGGSWGLGATDRLGSSAAGRPARGALAFVPERLRIDVVAVRLGPREPFPLLGLEHIAGVG